MATPLSPVIDCTDFVAAEGRYELLQDMHLDQVLPHPVIPTLVSSVSVKYKDYFNNAAAHNGIARAHHGKQTSADSTLSTSNIDHLEERLMDFKLRDERGGGGGEGGDDATPATPLSRNFHGNLVDLPLYQDDLNGPKSPRNGMMSPHVMAPGPPPLKDSSGSNRHSDPYSQFGPPPSLPHQHQQEKQEKQPSSFRASLSRANSHYSQGDDNNGSSPSTPGAGSSTGFSSLFSSKRKKPKNNIAKTNSTFVSKITTNDNLAKILANRMNEDVYLFWNTGRTFTWSDLSQKPNEPLSHITFSKAFPTSHDVNILTRSCDHLDVIIGFSTGDIIWFDPLCNKYYRLNKQGTIKDSPVTMIKWLPGSETQFMAAFQDGSIVIMDKERDDNAFTAPAPTSDTMFHVTRPKYGKHNPISHWQVSKKPIKAFAFSPDLQHVAVVAMDGALRIVDFHQERLLDTFSAYFGALTCVCWSPDGKYILTGGQDDLVTIWSFKDQRIVARCQGHQSYVTGVAFDPWRCDERNYRFGSVGEDAKLLLWDFSVGALHKPKAAVMQRRGSTATVSGMAAAGGGSGSYKPGHGSKGSISSLRGIGGHSLFSGHHTNKSSVSQAAPIIAEEPVLEQQRQSQGNGDASSTTSSTRHSSVHETSNPQHAHQPSQTRDAENASIGDASSTRSSGHSSILTSDGGGNSGSGRVPSGPWVSSSSNGVISGGASTMTSTTAVTVQEGVDAGPSSPMYKNVARARTLPHLHLKPTSTFSSDHSNNSTNDHGHHQLDAQSQKSGHSFSSLFKQQHKTHGGVAAQGMQVVRPPEPRSHVAMLQPLMAKGIHQEPLSGITFREDAIMTTDRRGHIKVWKRPPPLPHQQLP
ncbi:hypothetical protein BGX29_007275 [Mortierella sp. GBA35]|nr:hypothetical protein BGX29_007275 [Mortierella sp. GBA35]